VIERIRRYDKEKCLAIGWRAHDYLSSEIGCGARPVLNDKLLAKSLRQPLTHEACDDVGRATAGRESDDDAHRPRRIGLRPRYPRHSRQSGSPYCEMQKFPAGKFHFESPFTSFDHLVGEQLQRVGHLDAERLCGFEIDDKLELGRP
jgi:hypothetical protein